MRKRFKELCIEVTKNREELKEQRELIDFLLEHDRNDVVFVEPVKYHLSSLCLGNYESLVAKFVYNREIKVVKICGCFYAQYDGIVFAMPNIQELIENTEEKFVVKVSNKDNLFTPRYYRVEKHNSQVADVTEYYKKEEPQTVDNPDTPTTSCENCAKKSSCKLQNKVNFSQLMPKMILCDEFTPTETDFKYFTAEQVRNMSQKEVRENYSDIMKSMKNW